MAGALLGVLFAAGNARAAATTYTVNVTTDSAPTTGGTGSGSAGDLRYALTQAEASGNSGSTITFSVTGTIPLAAALPAITQDTTITGPGADKLTISGANAYAVLSIGSGTTVSISGLTIANGKGTATASGGIANAGTLTISNSAFSGNSASSAGAISNTGTLNVSGSTFLNNSATSGNAGAIHDNAGTVTLYNNTFYGNSATGNGGAIYVNSGALTVSGNTFAENVSQGNGGAVGIGSAETSASLTNNLFHNNSAATTFGAVNSGIALTTEANNVFHGNAQSSGNETSFSLAASDVTGQDPKLLPLGNYGGTTLSMIPQPGSPAICAGSVSYAKDASGATLTTDQRGFELNAANCSNGGVDAGAIQTNYLMVTMATDPGPSSCTSTDCSLRDAIMAANTAGGDIGFKSSLNGSTITLASALPAITGAVNIIGPGADQLTVSGGGSTTVGSVFTVNSGAVATLYGLTIANGNVDSGDGGGINNSGTLMVMDSAVSGNLASTTPSGGGGIYNSGVLVVLDSTISGNTASNSGGSPNGGGLDNAGGTLTVMGSTVSENVAGTISSGIGGGISSVGTLTVTDSTVSGNTAQLGGGIYVGSGTASIANSIASGNTASANADIGGAYTNKGGNQIGTSVNLAALGSYGGATQTMLPLPGSTALCAGSSSLAVDANGNSLTTDQRGFTVGLSSKTGGYCTSGQIDAGAVQTDYTSVQFTNDTGYSALVGATVSPAPIVSVTENGQNIGGVPITLSFSGPHTATPTGLGPVTTAAGTGATFSSITVDTAGLTDTLSASLPLGTSPPSATANLEIDGPGVLSLSPASGALTDAYIGAAYSEQLSATGGKAGYTYALSSGSTLPTGLTLSTAGLLSGKPTALDSYSFSITVTDKKGNTGTAAYTLAVDLDQTSVAVTSSKNPSNVDDSVTFTATITNTSGGSVPSTGTVAFKSDGAGISSCGTQALVVGTSSSTATCSIDSLAAATALSPHSIVASYSGDTATYAGSDSASFSQTVNKASTAVGVTITGTAGVNQQVTLTATVSPISPVALGSGTMAFFDGLTQISECGTAAVTASTGKAICTTTFMTAGSHTIKAVYSGDANYAQTQSGSVTPLALSVSKANTTLSLASTDNTTSGIAADTSNLNDSVTFTATVAPATPVTGGAALSGTVGFTSNGQTLCAPATGTWDSTAQTYQVTCTTSNLLAGTASIVASYSNDANYNITNNNLTQTVNKQSTATAVTSSTGGTSTVNQPVTFTANVTPITGAVKLSGNVTFTATNISTSAVSTLCNAVGITASTGVATCPVSSLTPGSYTITASYGSDSNYDASSSTVSQTVGKATAGITLISSANPSTINQQVTLTANVTAPAGGIKLDGNVSFTDNGTAISDCPATTINPNNPTVTCKTSSLAYGTHSLVASYSGDPNFGDVSSTAVSQVVNAAPTTTSIISSAPGNTSSVDQSVSFTATVSGASGAVQFSGKMSFTDNGNAIQGCSALNVDATKGTAECTTSSLLAGSHAIAASYAGDTNFSTSGGSLTEKVNAAASSVALISSPNPSVVLNPNGYNDVVTLTAAVSPSSGVPLSGGVTFTDSGASIPECPAAVPVDASGKASCLTTSLGFGTHTIQAAYGGDNNFTGSSSSATQAVEDYTLAASPTSTVTVSQRFTNTTDVFSPQAITVAASPIAGFTGQLALTCNVVPLSAPEGAVPPVCNLANSTLSIAAGQQQPVALTIDAGTGSTPVATPGTYNVSVTGVDATTGLTHASAAFVVRVRYQAPPLTIVSGATTSNTTTVDFTLPPNVGISDILCASVTGPTLTSSVAPVALSMGCTFSPSTIPATAAGQDVLVTVAVSTGASTSARLLDGRTSVMMAGLFGIPILALLGFMPGGKSSRKVFFRYLGIVFVAVLLFQATGCGGGSFTAPPSVSGQTPPGSYNILVEGTGTDKQTYEAVIQVNVTR